MYNYAIESVTAREILDSRGRPTVEACVKLSGGAVGIAAVPSGASKGTNEVLELRDLDETRFLGGGVLRAVRNVNTTIDHVLHGMDAGDIYAIDQKMKTADGTQDFSNLGANAILSVSLACAHASANMAGQPLYRFLGGVHANLLPVPMMNVLNGGAHAANNLDVQEFMIMPVGAKCFSQALRMGAEVYQRLGLILKAEKLSTAVGDEGGYAPDLEDDAAALELLIRAVEEAGYRMGRDFLIAIDAAAGEWKCNEVGHYRKPKSGKEYCARELVSYWKDLCASYPICSIEDGLDEEDWEGWKRLTDALDGKVQLVGDDLFVTNTDRLRHGIKHECANSILIKPNQIGTLSATMDAIAMAHKAGYTAIMSHRSGETEDTTIADLAVALCTGQIKCGAPCRSERNAKYNRLLWIEQQLGKRARFAKKFRSQ